MIQFSPNFQRFVVCLDEFQGLFYSFKVYIQVFPQRPPCCKLFLDVQIKDFRADFMTICARQDKLRLLFPRELKLRIIKRYARLSFRGVVDGAICISYLVARANI